MRGYLKIILTLSLITLGYYGVSFAQNTIEKDKITNIIKQYENSLNNEDLKGVMSLFSKEAVLVLQGTPTSTGTQSIKSFYKKIFDVIDFNLEFDIKELVIMSAEWAFVRTSTRDIDSEDKSEKGHEIFLLSKKADSNWVIARYAGSSAK